MRDTQIYKNVAIFGGRVEGGYKPGVACALELDAQIQAHEARVGEELSCMGGGRLSLEYRAHTQLQAYAYEDGGQEGHMVFDAYT